jgi:hypothetical protein
MALVIDDVSWSNGVVDGVIATLSLVPVSLLNPADSVVTLDTPGLLYFGVSSFDMVAVI